MRWRQLSTFPKPTIAMVNGWWVLTDVLGWRDTMYYSLTGEAFDGQTAARILVNHAVSRTVLKAETIKLAHQLMEKNPAACHTTKGALRAVRTMDIRQSLDHPTGWAS